MNKDIKKIIILTILLICSSALFLLWNVQGNWGFVLPLRLGKLVALLLVAYAVGVSTLLFQTLTNNPILTPSVLGFDTLYIFLQTLLVFALGGTAYTQLPLMGKFAFELVAMMGGALLLFRLLLKQGGRDLARMILIGVIFGVLFRSLSSLFQRMIDPEEFAVAQANTFASFNTVNTNLLAMGGTIVALSAVFLWYERHRLDVHLLGRDQVTNLGIHYQTYAVDFTVDCGVGSNGNGDSWTCEFFWFAGVCVGELFFRQRETCCSFAYGVFNFSNASNWRTSDF